MFFSPPSFSRELNQKKDDCVQKAREGMGNPGKAWEIPGTAKSPGQQNPGKSRALELYMASQWLEPFIYFSFQLENWSNQLSAIKSHFKSHKAKKAIIWLRSAPSFLFLGWFG